MLFTAYGRITIVKQLTDGIVANVALFCDADGVANILGIFLKKTDAMQQIIVCSS